MDDGYGNFTEPEQINTSYKNPAQQFKDYPTETEDDLPLRTFDLESILLTSPRPNRATWSSDI